MAVRSVRFKMIVCWSSGIRAIFSSAAWSLRHRRHTGRCKPCMRRTVTRCHPWSGNIRAVAGRDVWRVVDMRRCAWMRASNGERPAGVRASTAARMRTSEMRSTAEACPSKTADLAIDGLGEPASILSRCTFRTTIHSRLPTWAQSGRMFI